MNKGQQAMVGVSAAVMIASGVAAPEIAKDEGWKSVGYLDSVGVATYCLGATKAAVVGKAYSDDFCMQQFVMDVIAHGMGIAQCLPENLPTYTRAGLQRIGYNIGTAAFCKSSMSVKAKAGDLAGACAAISLYVYARGKDCRQKASNCGGIPVRRDEERAMCEAGLRS